jgi:hypothetical protein
MSVVRAIGLSLAVSIFLGSSAFAAQPIPQGDAAAAVPGGKPVKPYQTYITIQNYSLQSSGEPGNGISNVHLELTFPNGKKYVLPEGGQDWPVGNGQMQTIDQTYQLPFKYIQKDGFNFTVQIVRRGADLLPCQFKVEQLSVFNRSYVCHTDINWQEAQKTPEDQIDREAVQLRVSTDIKENLSAKASADVADKVNEVPTKFLTIE